MTDGLGRAERVAVALFLTLLAVLYAWAARYRLDPLDEGYFVYTSSRVLAGELPYRDFATPYTPGFFYLNALLFRVFGMDLLTLRLSLVVVRLATMLLIYVLARRIMPAPFTVIAVFVLLVEDQVPGSWEAHPAWHASLWFLVAVWCVCRHRERGGWGWWLAAGVAAGVSFAFKQNIGLFALAALVGVALVEERALPVLPAVNWLGRFTRPDLLPWLSALRRLAGPAYLLALCGGVAWGMRAHLNPLLFAMHAAPFGALGLERLRASGEGQSAGDESGQIRAPTPNPSPNVGGGREGALAAAPVRIGLAILAFGAVTAPWLTALAVALGPAETPFGAFVGAIDTAGYYLPMDELREELKPMLGVVVLAPFLVWVLWQPWKGLFKGAVVAAAVALAAGLVQELMRTASDVHARLLRAAVLLSVKGAYNFILYLPLAAFWSAFGLLAARRVPSSVGFTLRWYLLAGSLLLLNQYPRMDEVHLMFSAPLIWIVGSYTLWRLFVALTRGLGAGRSAKLGRAAMYVALLALPLVAVWPSLEDRRRDHLHRQPGGLLVLGTPGYVDVGLPGASVAEMDILVTRYHLVAQYFERESKSGDRIFVYPAAPLLYFLLDRPNATRFNHLFPGLLSPAEVRETIDRLASVPATHVIWDSFGSDYWVEAVQKGAYQQLTDYIWEAYEEVGDFGGLVILRRKAPQPGGAV